MVSGKYKKFLIRYGIFISLLLVFFLVILNLANQYHRGLLKYSLVENQGFDGALITILTIGTVLLGTSIGGYILSPLFLIAHKKTVGRKMAYRIQEKPRSGIIKKSYIKTFFPALITINLSLILAYDPSIQTLLLDTLSSNEWNLMYACCALFPFTGAIAMAVFSPIWFLQDGGLVYSNKEKVKVTSDPTEIRSLGGWYSNILKGFSGIAVIMQFYILVADLISYVDTSLNTTTVLFLVLWIIMPLILTFLYTIGIVALDIIFEKRKKFIIKVAEKFGITQKIEPLGF